VERGTRNGGWFFVREVLGARGEAGNRRKFARGEGGVGHATSRRKEKKSNHGTGLTFGILTRGEEGVEILDQTLGTDYRLRVNR